MSVLTILQPNNYWKITLIAYYQIEETFVNINIYFSKSTRIPAGQYIVRSNTQLFTGVLVGMCVMVLIVIYTITHIPTNTLLMKCGI